MPSRSCFGVRMIKRFVVLVMVLSLAAMLGCNGKANDGERVVRDLSVVELSHVKQCYVQNARDGLLLVMEGNAFNRSEVPLWDVQLKATLFGAAEEVLDSQTLLSGNELSVAQLQTLSRLSIEEALSSEVGYLAHNSFIEPGDVSRFMVVFFAPPPELKEFEIEVIDVAGLE